MQSEPQFIPAGEEVTTPEPFPEGVTVTGTPRIDVAETITGPVMVTVQVLDVTGFPEHASPQLLNTLFCSGVAVIVTCDPSANSYSQYAVSELQSIPGGSLVTIVRL